MGLDHVPVIVHFGPEQRKPKHFENFNPNDHTALLNFFTAQSGSQLNLEEAMKPEPNYNHLLVGVTAAAIIGGLIYTGALSASTVFKNVYIWSIAIMVNFNF